MSVAYHPWNGAQTGKVSSVSATFDGTALAFDYTGALLEEVDLTGPIAATVEWTYQTGFLVASEKVTDVGSTHTITYAYDDDRLLEQAGDLTIARDPGGDKNGLIAGTTVGYVTDSYSYNDFGELEYYQALHDGTDNLYEVFYERDNLGRVIRRAERVLTGSVEVREYAYHVRGWLQTVWIGTGSCTLSTCDCTVVTCAIGEAYTYDANGNRETASGSLVTAVVGTDTVYDAQDRQDEYGAAARRGGAIRTDLDGVNPDGRDRAATGGVADNQAPRPHRDASSPCRRTPESLFPGAGRTTALGGPSSPSPALDNSTGTSGAGHAGAGCNGSVSSPRIRHR